MKGPYTFTVTLADTVGTGVESVKRDAIREMRVQTKLFGVSEDGIDCAEGDVRDRDGQLVRQVVAYRTKSGVIKLRDLEL